MGKVSYRIEGEILGEEGGKKRERNVRKIERENFREK